MPINYLRESEKYKPKKIRELLISEAPPPSGKIFFYLPRSMPNKLPIRNDRSLAATIFYHYFYKRPETKIEYRNFLFKLKSRGIFLIDIYDKPLKVRGNKKNLKKIINEITKLRGKIKSRKIFIKDKNIIFLLARKNYLKYIKKEFPNSKYCSWIDFRIPIRI